eukprot:340766-Rhodomonas_salina.3
MPIPTRPPPAIGPAAAARMISIGVSPPCVEASGISPDCAFGSGGQLSWSEEALASVHRVFIYPTGIQYSNWITLRVKPGTRSCIGNSRLPSASYLILVCLPAEAPSSLGPSRTLPEMEESRVQKLATGTLADPGARARPGGAPGELEP